MSLEHLRLFALNAAAGFGREVARALGTALAPHEERDFEDGEWLAAMLEREGRAFGTGACGRTGGSS